MKMMMTKTSTASLTILNHRMEVMLITRRRKQTNLEAHALSLKARDLAPYS
jgi:hypothetical protein